MTVFVSVLGVILLGVGITVLVSPGTLRRAVETFVKPATVPLFAIIRVGFGILLVIASADTRLPVFVWALGMLLILAGVALPILGVQRTLKITKRWQARSDGSLRSWALLAILFGALLIWAAA